MVKRAGWSETISVKTNIVMGNIDSSERRIPKFSLSLSLRIDEKNCLEASLLTN